MPRVCIINWHENQRLPQYLVPKSNGNKRRTIWRGRIIDCNGTQIKVNSLFGHVDGCRRVFVFFGPCTHVCVRQRHENATSDNGKCTKINFISSGRHPHTAHRTMFIVIILWRLWLSVRTNTLTRTTHTVNRLSFYLFISFYWRNTNPISLWYVWTTTRNRIKTEIRSTNVASYGLTRSRPNTVRLNSLFIFKNSVYIFEFVSALFASNLGLCGPITSHRTQYDNKYQLVVSVSTVCECHWLAWGGI